MTDSQDSDRIPVLDHTRPPVYPLRRGPSRPSQKVLKFLNDSDEGVSCCVYGELVSEICDIFIYFCRLSDLCGFFEDIKKEALRP